MAIDRQVSGISDPARRIAPGLSENERLDRLRLARSENVGPVTFRQLIDRFGSATAAIEALPRLAARGGRARSLRLCPAAEAVIEADRIAKLGGRLVVWGEPDYPFGLSQIADAPAVLTVLGDPALLRRTSVAIVGSRQASLIGRKIAAMFARQLGEAAYVIVSGLARGIDSVAHAEALTTGTVAVLAGGVDVVYPPEHRPLYDQIIATGAVISEMPLGMPPQARHFPRRNRLIAGLSVGVVVIEAHLRSGSLITAQLAVDQGREVFAVPGSPFDPRARGCNQLIRQGAMLVESGADVIDALAATTLPRLEEPDASEHAPPIEAPADRDVVAARTMLRECLSVTPVAVDELVRSCQLSPAVVTAILLEWELAGDLVRHSGNRVSYCTDRMDH